MLLWPLWPYSHLELLITPCLVSLRSHTVLIPRAAELECLALVNSPQWVMGLKAGLSHNFKSRVGSFFAQMDLKVSERPLRAVGEVPEVTFTSQGGNTHYH